MTRINPVMTTERFIEWLNSDQWEHKYELDADCDRTQELEGGDMEFHGLGKVYSHYRNFGPDEVHVCIYCCEAYTFRLMTADSLKTGGKRPYLKDIHVLDVDGELLTEDQKAALLPEKFTTPDYRMIEAVIAANK